MGRWGSGEGPPSLRPKPYVILIKTEPQSERLWELMVTSVLERRRDRRTDTWWVSSNHSPFESAKGTRRNNSDGNMKKQSRSPNRQTGRENRGGRPLGVLGVRYLWVVGRRTFVVTTPKGSGKGIEGKVSCFGNFEQSMDRLRHTLRHSRNGGLPQTP